VTENPVTLTLLDEPNLCPSTTYVRLFGPLDRVLMDLGSENAGWFELCNPAHGKDGPSERNNNSQEKKS